MHTLYCSDTTLDLLKIKGFSAERPKLKLVLSTFVAANSTQENYGI